MDNYFTHYNDTLKLLLDKARVILVYVPAHSLHLMQPLNDFVFKPIKDR